MISKYKYSRLALLLWTSATIALGFGLAKANSGAIIIVPTATINHPAPAACSYTMGASI